MMSFSRVLVGILCTVLFTILAFNFPRYTVQDDDAMFAQLAAVMSAVPASEGADAPEFLLPVMSFNMRLDGLERDPRNHFTQRLHRIARLFNRTNPWIVGLQEPFSGQLAHQLSVLPARYQAVTYKRPVGAAAQMYDAKIAIVYDSEKLALQEQDYMWLSRTPNVEDSRDWESSSPRVLNIARFRVRRNAHTHRAFEGQEILHFNTHLDVRSEEARREQSRLITQTIADWRVEFPHALVILTGDFNTAPGQAAYMTLTRGDNSNGSDDETSTHRAEGLLDSYAQCRSAARGDGDACVSNAVAHSFHGWQGTRLHSWGARVAQGALFTLHGLGLKLPHHLPQDAGEVWSAARDLATSVARPRFAVREAIPALPWDRFHVDWILYAPPLPSSPTPQAQPQPQSQTPVAHAGSERPAAAAPTTTKKTKVGPVFSALLDARMEDYSSDHFPLLTVFRLTQLTE